MAFDIALVIGLTFASVDIEHPFAKELYWWVFAAPLAAGIVIRRQRPLTAVILTGVGAAAHLLNSTEAEPLDLAVLLTLYTLAAAARPRRVAAVTLAVLLACVGLIAVLQPPAEVHRKGIVKRAEQAPIPNLLDPGVFATPVRVRVFERPGTVTEILGTALWGALGVMLLLGLAYAVGDNVRGRRAHLRTLENRAADLEREQRHRVALATAAERARITREMHDVVAHGLSVMVVQAQGGAAALRRHPDRTEAALQNVITTGRASLTEMRRLLAVVRQDPAEDVALAPPPGVGALPDLIDQVRAAGNSVTFVVEGEPVPLPAGVDLSAYRIAQECLTNTLKHAGRDAKATVRLGYRADALEIEITDDGTGEPVPPDGGGNGLRGIGERVALLGGELTAGPGEAGGFQVRAALPLRQAADL
jgi:signal transduction histidine kinase